MLTPGERLVGVAEDERAGRGEVGRGGASPIEGVELFPACREELFETWPDGGHLQPRVLTAGWLDVSEGGAQLAEAKGEQQLPPEPAEPAEEPGLGEHLPQGALSAGEVERDAAARSCLVSLHVSLKPAGDVRELACLTDPGAA
jgi:hypothetical protein